MRIAVRMGIEIVQNHPHKICASGARLGFGILDNLPGCVPALDDKDCGVHGVRQNPSVGYIQQRRRIKYDEIVFLRRFLNQGTHAVRGDKLSGIHRERSAKQHVETANRRVIGHVLPSSLTCQVAAQL